MNDHAEATIERLKSENPWALVEHLHDQIDMLMERIHAIEDAYIFDRKLGMSCDWVVYHRDRVSTHPDRMTAVRAFHEWVMGQAEGKG